MQKTYLFNFVHEEAKGSTPRMEEFMRTDLAILIAIILVGSCYTWLAKKLRTGKLVLPPGPRGLPLVGYLPFLNPNLHIQFFELAQTYGPIIKLRLGSKLCIVVSSPSLAKQVLKDHDAVLANRDAPIAALAITYGGSDVAWGAYGPNWRMLRKICVKEMLSNASLDACCDLRHREIKHMVSDIYARTSTPVDICEQMLVTVLGVITSMLWGGTLEGEERVRVGGEFRVVVGELVVLMGKPNISDLFPVLAWLDIQGVESDVKRLLCWFDEIFDSVIAQRMKMSGEEGGEESIKKGRKDFLQSLLQLMEERDPKMPLTMIQLKALLLDMVVGGADTSASTLEWAMAELIQNSEMMSRVQHELDQVVGTNSTVEETHLPKLHYLNAVVKEVLRLHAVVPLLIPRRSIRPCVVGGYFIPEGSQVLVNAWALHRDPDAWENPTEFKPERFLGEQSNREYGGNDFHYLPFGSGRRMCAGIPMAEKLIMYVLASLLHSFSWKLPEGTELDLCEKFGIILNKEKPLVAIPVPRLPNPRLYNCDENH